MTAAAVALIKQSSFLGTLLHPPKTQYNFGPRISSIGYRSHVLLGRLLYYVCNESVNSTANVVVLPAVLEFSM